jgi:tricorn protease
VLRIGVALFVFALAAASAQAIEKIRMVSDPAVSPDGKSVVFSWNSDIWLVSTTGGPARQLTQHPAEDRYPRFSPNGRMIAFTSMRTGSRQVHITSPVGGIPKRLTTHSEGYRIEGWHPDGKSVLTTIVRDHFWRWADRFSLVNLKDRGPEQILFDGYGKYGHLSPEGQRILFNREGEKTWRKGYRGPRASQIWMYDLSGKKFTELVNEEQESRWPLWHPKGESFYYAAERNGVANLMHRNIATGDEKQLTSFKDDSVMYPSISKDGSTIVFRQLFDLWVLKTDGEAKPRKIEIRNVIDHTAVRYQRSVLKKATEVTFSKDGLEVAFIAGGDLWVMDTDLRQPVQISKTSTFERNPLYSHDGNSIFFIAEKDGQPDIWRVMRSDTSKVWWQNKKFKFYRLTKDADTEDNLSLNPAGNLLAFSKGRGDLWTMRPDGKAAKKVFESWNKPQYDWSPDGQWMVYSQYDNDFNRDIWIRPIDGHRKPFNLSRHPDNDSSPTWSPDGKMIAFSGRRRATETDIYYVMLRNQDHQADARDKKLKSAIDKVNRARQKPRPSATKSVGTGTKTPRPPDSKSTTDERKKRLLELLKKKRAEQSSPLRANTREPASKSSPPLSVAPKKAAAKPEPKPKNEPTPPKTEKPKPSPTVVAKTVPATRNSNPNEVKQPASTTTSKSRLQIDFDGLHERLRRVSITNATETGLMWSPDSKKLAFTATIAGKRGTYTISVPGSSIPRLLNSKTGTQARWVSTRRSSSSRISSSIPSFSSSSSRTSPSSLSSLLASRLSSSSRPSSTPSSLSSGQKIYWLSSGLPGSISGSVATSYPFSARQTIRVGNRFREALNSAWRAMRDNFYDENLGGHDWEAIRKKYVDMAGESPDGRTLANVINLMLGELNGSHLGFSYRGPSFAPSLVQNAWNNTNAHLGLRFDTASTNEGIMVANVIRNSPADRKDTRVAAGEYVLEINGTKVGPKTDLSPVLNVDLSRIITLKVRTGTGKGAKTREVALRPTSYSRIRGLLYEQWIDNNQQAVTAASDGTFGYLHIAKMSMTSFYRFEEELHSVAAGKDGIVIDVRENGGGSTTDHLLTILTQPRHAITVPRGGGPGYPQDRKIYASWHKPVVVLCNQNSYSNAEIFSHAIRHLKRGKLVGTPTAGGVISTGLLKIMDLGSIRMPFRGWFRLSDGQDMELNPVKPHHIIWPKPGDLPAGRDSQLTKAIKVLKKEVRRYQNRPEVKLIKASER